MGWNTMFLTLAPCHAFIVIDSSILSALELIILIIPITQFI